MSTQVYDIGDRVKMQAVFASSTGAKNPSNVKLVITSPSNADTVINATSTGSTAFAHSTKGTWSYQLTASAAGRWRYQFNSTGTLISSEGGAFTVRRPSASTST